MTVIDPITREEILLAKALGENVPDIVPVIRKEMYLAKIAGADIQTPEAITREEMYLDAIANGTEVTIEPITRKEMFYAKALGLIENAPEPITRIEGLLNQITAGGGGGSYDKYSWEGVFASIDAGTYATDYAIGDMIPLDLGSEGLINMEIVAFDADNLADGSGKAPITWAAKELLKTSHRMNPKLVTNDDGTYQEGTGGIGGWEKSELRAYLNDTIKPMIPENVRSAIKDVEKSQNAYNVSGGSFTQTTIDDLWIPSSNQENGYKITDSRKKVDETSIVGYWFRRFYSKDKCIYAHPYGGTGNSNPGNENAICLCFCT
jgi:hypothetical protein